MFFDFKLVSSFNFHPFQNSRVGFFSFFFWKIFNFKSMKISKTKTFLKKKFVKSHDVSRVFLAQKLTGRGHESFLLFAGSAPHFR